MSTTHTTHAARDVATPGPVDVNALFRAAAHLLASPVEVNDLGHPVNQHEHDNATALVSVARWLLSEANRREEQALDHYARTLAFLQGVDFADQQVRARLRMEAHRKLREGIGA